MNNTDYFDQVAGEWDTMRTQFFSDEVREAAMKIAGVQAGRTAADIGAGTGFLTEGLLRRGLRVIAVDHSAQMLEQMKGKFAESGRLEVRLGESERLPIDDGTVDYVFANMVLHHVESPAGAIREMARILKPSGTLVITDVDEHTHEFLRIEHHDRWLGFKRRDVHQWLVQAGLGDAAVSGIGQKCRATSESRAETTDITIFAASGRKASPAWIASANQRARADSFLALHRTPPPFVLANCWDVVTAALFAREGFRAIGTSSYATSAMLGLHDGERIPPQETVELVRRLVGHVKLPVSADIEAGYAESIEGVVESARAVFEAGAVGINIEDSSGDPDWPLYDVTVQREKIAAIRAMTDAAEFHPVINARTDVFLLGLGDARSRLREAIERGRAYVEAGADCVFVPDMGDLDVAAMRDLVREIDAPINIIAGPSTPPMAQLGEIGIARVSLGPRMMRAALGLFREIAREILDHGTFTMMTTGALSYEETNELLAGRSECAS